MILLAQIRRWLLLLLLLSALVCVLFPVLQRSSLYKDHLYVQLLSESSDKQLKAASVLVYLGAQDQLLRVLQSDNSSARDLGQRALEHLWFRAAGEQAYQLMQTAHKLAETNDLEAALGVVNSLIRHHPKYAEGWNQRASLYWQLGDYEKSIADSTRALRLNPNHYGAWQGLGICFLKQGQFTAAAACFKAALKIIPHDRPTREAVQKCEDLLKGSEVPAPWNGRRDLVKI